MNSLSFWHAGLRQKKRSNSLAGLQSGRMLFLIFPTKLPTYLPAWWGGPEFDLEPAPNLKCFFPVVAKSALCPITKQLLFFVDSCCIEQAAE
jgi:hypothetical protein